MANWLRLRRQSHAPREWDGTETIYAAADGTLMHMDPDGAESELGSGESPGGSQTITDPTDIPDCALWLDASTLTLADDDPVETWPDGSGNDYDATQGAASNEIDGVADFPASAGDFTLSVDDGENPPVEVGPIAWNADAAAVQAAFTTAGITTSCTGALPDTDVAVEFTGAFGGKAITMTVADDNLTDGTASVTPTTPGGVQPAAPVCKTAVLNGKRVVRFDASGDPDFQYLQLSGDGLDLFRDVAGLTVAVVCANITDSTDAYLLAANDADNLGTTRALLQLSATTGGPLIFNCDNEDGENGRIGHVINDVMTGLGDEGVSGAVVVLGAANLVQGSVLAASSQYTAAVQVADPNGAARGNTPDTPSLAIRIGVLTDETPTSGTTGDIAEIVVYQRGLNASERRQLIEYLSAKWGTL